MSSSRQTMGLQTLEWITLIGVFSLVTMATSMPPAMAPFFFLCNYHGDQDQSTLDNGEVAISVSIANNPEHYVPGNIYKVTVVSSHDFDGFLLTGVYTAAGAAHGPLAGVIGTAGSGLHCMPVHNYVSDQPKHSLSFFWRAPPTGTGCINFLATATLRQDVLFKDTTVMQICEEGADVTVTLRPALADVHEPGIVLRDDFDSSSALDANLWSHMEGAEMGDGCGPILHGHSLVFCEPHAMRSLMTVPLNLTTASVVQFALGAGICQPSVYDRPIEVLYSTDSCTNWTVVDKIRSPGVSAVSVHLVHLPLEARTAEVCLQWRQQLAPNTNSFAGCWGLDNVVVVNRATPPDTLYDTFDPVDPTNWIFFPGGQIKHKCQSDKQTLVFPDARSPKNYATTRDIRLDPPPFTPLLTHGFDGRALQGWIIKGGRLGMDCDNPGRAASLVFDGGAKSRQLCTPHLDLTAAAGLRFSFRAGGVCQKDSLPLQKSKVFVYVEDETNQTTVILTLDMHPNKGTQHISVPIPPIGRGYEYRICWIQKQHGGQGWDVWQTDNVQLIPLLPEIPNHFIQFSMNTDCVSSSRELRVDLEFSSDQGEHWFPVYSRCLPGQCPGQLQPRSNSYSSQQEEGWIRHTLPLPLSAMTPYVRFRWRQTSRAHSGGWALDNVFVGKCVDGCNGHGQCTGTGCKCDYGYDGASCEEPSGHRPTLLIETLSTVSSIRSHFEVIKGAALSYSCGLVASGKAVVFSREGPRMLQTIELNTTLSGFLQFSLRLGSSSDTGDCPAPTNRTESVFLHYTCSGGVLWSLLKAFYPEPVPEAKVHLVMLPEAGRRSACRFRWWQAVHSGAGRDVWAVDDVSLTHHMYNTINLDFQSRQDADQALDVHLGDLDTFCGRSDVLRFIRAYEESQTRYVMTTSMHIGPSYALQFDIILGCSTVFTPHLDNVVRLEYSSDHGMTWQLVRGGCHPPAMCAEYHQPTLYDASQYGQWTRVTILLPQNTWSGATRFRWLQTKWAPTDSWAIDNLYVGQQCPAMCGGHGHCQNVVCSCDIGYHGDACSASVPHPSHLKTDFTILSNLDADWLTIQGGAVTGANHGCGVILSGESLYFSKSGMRQAVTRDLSTLWGADYLQFYVRVGGTNSLLCGGSTLRQENVLVQYSNNGGITWGLLKELHAEDYRKQEFVHIVLPLAAKTEATRFRFWQPTHSGEGTDQWAVDEIVVGIYHGMQQLLDDFEAVAPRDGPAPETVWLTVTEGMYDTYCQSPDHVLMFINQNNDKFAMTKDLLLRPGDVVQFKINVGCSETFSLLYPVLLQYSQDSGRTWSLLEKPCPLSSSCHGHYSDGSIYYSGTYGQWSLVVIQVMSEVTKGKVNLRWWQAGSATSSFAIDDVYIGSPCPSMCNGHGVCVQGRCKCDTGFTGVTCQGSPSGTQGLVDRFDDMSRPGPVWDVVRGGYLGRGCGKISTGNALYFHGEGTREARTVPVDIRNIKILEFKARIGSPSGQRGCGRPQGRDEGVLVQFSTNNGITWEQLKVLDAEQFSKEVSTVTVPIPATAKTAATVIRWWQPITKPGTKRAEWAIDDVTIAVNDTSAAGFQDNFDPMLNDAWHMALNAIPKVTCNSRSNALEFSKNEGQMRYAETWDFEVTELTFLQFDIAMGCSGTFSTVYSVQLQYSVDRGRAWHPVQGTCLPPALDCSGYHQSSTFLSQAHSNWTRVTVHLPPGAVSPSTRFRWLQGQVALRGNVWALDNIYLGDGCSWMCSGHGYCRRARCVCDAGFSGPFCVPQTPLPMTLKSSFEGRLSDEQWPEVYGGEPTNICGTLVSGKAITFYKKDLRMLVSRDLDVSMATYMQFTFRYGCGGSTPSWPHEHSVLLQYSNNGGIKWNRLKLIHFKEESKPRFLSVQIPSTAKTNATRFRFWQPQHDGLMKSVWSLDDLLIGGSMVAQDSVYETFDAAPHPDDWLFWPGGRIGRYCDLNTRSDTIYAGTSTMVFQKTDGERSVTTRDLNVNDMSVIQFDLNVGCSSGSDSTSPVRLEYSEDGGKTWGLVVPTCSQDSLPSCTDQSLDTTLYYTGTSPFWRRIIVPLSSLRICGLIRFRWYQGHFRSSESVPDWAVDNVYVGMQCEGHCSGHGICVNGLLCECDDAYSSSRCTSASRRPAHLLEDFDGIAPSTKATTWLTVSGGQTSTDCGVLVSGASFHFTRSGHRAIISADLDLSVARVVQFVLRLGCGSTPPRQQAEAVLLQYSTDGGTSWRTVESFSFSSTTARPVYVSLTVPDPARTNATRVRWWQPSLNGTFLEDWAIDQIYIGGHISGQVVVQDDVSPAKTSDMFRSFSPWTYWPGSVRQPVCGSETNALHFTGVTFNRELWTTDVTVTGSTYIQFDLSMGCTPGDTCYEIYMEYSLDMGRSWDLVQRECLPSNVDCNDYYPKSVFSSEVYYDWHRITLLLPYYTRSPATRFRWRQRGPYKTAETWAVTRLYLGDECSLACSGHGRCDRAVCRCDAGWGGVACSDPESLPSSLSDDFSAGPARSSWNSVVGGALSAKCGVLVAGTSLHFTGTCRRQLVSRDLDLRSAMFIQFHFRFGCVAPPTRRDEGVLIDYSSNGGISWSNLLEIYYDQYHTVSYIMADLPAGAKRNGVRIRWWQPAHAPGSKADWALDNVVIGGRETNPVAMRDSFDGANINQDILWLQKDNIETGSHCGKKLVLKGKMQQPQENVTLVTADMSVEEGYILQFSLSVGCNASWDEQVAPVHLEFSTDYGMTWRHVTQECLPYFPECNGQAATPSVFYRSEGWRRVTVLLLGPPVSRSTRFRWHQVFSESDQSQGESDHQDWALDDVYIGPACEDNCHGRGLCNYPRCSCDKFFGGYNCIRVTPGQTYLKDTFSTLSVDDTQWSLVQGGDIGPGCTTLVEGSGLHFNGKGQRQAVTIDLDLRNARFVQYHIVIGGASTRPACGKPTSRNESIVLQYSNDAGIMWHTLHLLDQAEYWEAPRRDYIPLPPSARTAATRVRWFQIPAPTTAPPRVGWTLDDVLIGGSEINPSELLERFEEQFDEQVWEFAPGGNRRSGVCGAPSGSMLWAAGSGVRSLTTSQLIIQEDYMLQFTIMVSCGAADHQCNLHQPVWLEYNKDPSSDRWELVFPQCFVNGHEYNMECKPYQYDAGTIYTANAHPTWRRVTLLLPAKVHSSHSRLRWIQTGVRTAPGPEWAVDDVYIGEKCTDLCNGRGDCRQGQCFCDPGYIGESCMPVRRFLPSHMVDGFDGGTLSALWAGVSGGEVGLGCGALLPFAHGRTLYFSGCGLREAVTTEMDTTKASKIMFVVQIGSHEQSATCNAEISGGRYGIVLLQYTKNKGIDWFSIASHEPHEFLSPRRVAYDIPQRARAVGVQFRWWQPEHRGAQHDQWAIDYVEIIMTRREQMLRTMGGRRRHGNLISYSRNLL